MTLYEFNQLTFKEKYESVLDKGVFLDNYINAEVRLNCYAIDRFFVELVYDEKQNKITEIRSFKYGHELDKYNKNNLLNF